MSLSEFSGNLLNIPTFIFWKKLGKEEEKNPLLVLAQSFDTSKSILGLEKVGCEKIGSLLYCDCRVDNRGGEEMQHLSFQFFNNIFTFKLEQKENCHLVFIVLPGSLMGEEGIIGSIAFSSDGRLHKAKYSQLFQPASAFSQEFRY